ncbi:pectinesterase inhibitor 3-like [Tripterygium wilfordii]|uniref:pectinesterase inhibitor 3-like n=1 Tax=Tripterygium wilfordii TaxID=458696 RepID=UPI0018F80059|nr:pectinesterase inhibitor 3-like [Tripterygium wilfordii]
MRMNCLAFLSLLFTLLPFHLQSISTGTAYIHRSCNSTDDPKLCCKTLSRYPRVVQSNPARLARVAISVSHSHVNGVAAYLSNIINSREVSPTPIKDCADFLSDATEEIGDSLGQMREMGEDPGAPDFGSNVSNVETWMSAAFAYEELCKDELEYVTDVEMKKDLFDRVHHVQKITLNALGFAIEEECEHIRNILKMYEIASGQKVNLQKSSVFYSPNTKDDTKQAISLQYHPYG